MSGINNVWRNKGGKRGIFMPEFIFLKQNNEHELLNNPIMLQNQVLFMFGIFHLTFLQHLTNY